MTKVLDFKALKEQKQHKDTALQYAAFYGLDVNEVADFMGTQVEEARTSTEAEVIEALSMNYLTPAQLDIEEEEVIPKVDNKVVELFPSPMTAIQKEADKRGIKIIEWDPDIPY